MKPLTHFRKTRILPLLSLGATFVLAITAHAQNLYVSANVAGGNHKIFEYTADGTQSTYATGLDNPRGLAFDSLGNLFVAEILGVNNHVIGRALKFDLHNKVSPVGSRAWFSFVGLAIDSSGNVYVMATDDRSPTGAGTIFKLTPDGERIEFGSVPGTTPGNLLQANQGLAFDSAGNLYAADGGAQTIYKFAPNGTRTVFVGPDAFESGAYPTGLTFDSSGNLFVSTECFAPFFCEEGSDTILVFTPDGVESTFATGLTAPRGMAFDSSGNLFVAEAKLPGDILKFPPGGGEPAVFASGFGRAQYLTFGPPR